MRISIAVAVAAVLAGGAQAETIYGLTGANSIVTFDSATPGAVLTSGAIGGLAAGDVLTGIDLRPATNALYSVATNGTVYLLAKNNGDTGYTATSVGNIANPITGLGIGLDFNPVPDRLRLVTSDDLNYRINPGTAVAIKDGNITGPGGSTDLVGAAYTNSRPGATTATLYALDAFTDKLVRSTDPNAGIYVGTNTLGVAFGALGVDLAVADAIGFDISGGTGAAFFNQGNRFYTLDLTTGAATLAGNIGAGSLVGLTAAAVPEPATWAPLLTGFGLTGVAVRRRRQTVAA